MEADNSNDKTDAFRRQNASFEVMYGFPIFLIWNQKKAACATPDPHPQSDPKLPAHLLHVGGTTCADNSPRWEPSATAAGSNAPTPSVGSRANVSAADPQRQGNM
jgi:hypothetical protein